MVTMNKHFCPSCGSKNISTLFETQDFFLTNEIFTLLHCEDCKLNYTNPIPSNLDKYYETTEYLSHDTKNNGIVGKVYNYLRSWNLKHKYKIVTKYIKKGKLLDIGCGTGELLYHFKSNGWAVKGVEPSNKARELAINNYKLDVLNLPQLKNLTQEKFDVVSMWHVLEHVPDISNRLAIFSQLIKDDGIGIIAVPNFNAPDSKYYGKIWAALDVPRHLFHFTKESLRIILAKNNLKIIESHPMKLDAFYVSLLSEKYLHHKLVWIRAAIRGLLSNIKAKKDNNYSSMIFVVKKQK